MLTSSFINIMLVALPLGLWAGATKASPTLVFTAVRGPPGGGPVLLGLAAAACRAAWICGKQASIWRRDGLCTCPPAAAPPLPQNFLSLIPLALFLGEVTEDLAVRFGDTVGGLLNATFGNVVEL